MADHQHSGRDPHDKVSEKLNNQHTKMADEQHLDESLTTSFSSDDENYYGSENQRSSSSSSDDENSPVALRQPINPNCGRKDADWCRWKRPASILGGVTLLILFEFLCVLLFHFAIWIISFGILKLVHLLAILFICINSFASLKRCLMYAPFALDGIPEVAVRIFSSEFYGAFAGLHEAVTGTDKKKSILVVAVICVIAVIGSHCSYLLAVGRCCRCLLTIFSFMMISDLRHGAVNIMASEFRGAFADLREAVTGTDKKKIVLVVAVIWVIAFIGSCSSFPLTIFSFMIISSVVLLMRSLRQKIAICEDVLYVCSHDYCTKLRRLCSYDDDKAREEANVVLHIKTSISNRFASQCRAAFVTYRKTSILVVASLWLLFVIGSWRDFRTLALMLVVTHTVLFLYEKYEDQIDSFAHKVYLKAKEAVQSY